MTVTLIAVCLKCGNLVKIFLDDDAHPTHIAEAHPILITHEGCGEPEVEMLCLTARKPEESLTSN